MDQNSAAIKALKEFAKLQNPGYAFMIEAPWGAGKTHLIREQFAAELKSGGARYVTLNGVSNLKDFRRALLAESDATKLIEAAGSIGNTFGKLAKVGNVGSLIQDSVENQMVNNLPRLLIFDDVERCELEPGEILGAINEFVEHKKKNVVLCACQERIGGDDENQKLQKFLNRKEKVIGRTVHLVAEAASALPALVEAMPDGHGRVWLTANSGLVLEVFEDAKHSNLRVLRQCVHDCGRVIDVLDEDIRNSTTAMLILVRTYLALSMAVTVGELQISDLAERGNHRKVLKPKDEGECHPLYLCAENHPHAEIWAGSGSVFPIELGRSLIGVGYEAPDEINQALRSTGQFSGEKQKALWHRFVKWRRMSKADLENTYNEAHTFVLKADEIEPGPYIHVAHDLLSIEEASGGDIDKLLKEIEGQIDALAANKRIPAAAYGKGFGWSSDNGTFSYGGYAFDIESNVAAQIVERMRQHQKKAYDDTVSMEAERLLKLVQSDIEAFGREFSGQSGRADYYSVEILHELDAKKFSEAIFKQLTAGKFNSAGECLSALSDRHRGKDFAKEVDWASTVKEELECLAKETSATETARMDWFLRHHWRFP
ncbi:P-loop NTPase fold protein [uncultured Shimia sp.]|uniref:P-loop NTPase fold protein n=1 Tax=uncultured Shimia sp. TaxID=573152 RepID=UPI002603E8FE|nr:P-loop NTPase fold protein [uncultured Shimia sp.]